VNRRDAQLDLRAAGAEVRLIDDKLFTVEWIAPLDERNIFGWIANDIMMRNAWTGMRTKGTNPTLHDTGDPETLASYIAYQHDYPSADMLGHYTTEQ